MDRSINNKDKGMPQELKDQRVVSIALRIIGLVVSASAVCTLFAALANPPSIGLLVESVVAGLIGHDMIVMGNNQSNELNPSGLGDVFSAVTKMAREGATGMFRHLDGTILFKPIYKEYLELKKTTV